jgi:hypothetical protein
VWSLLGAIGAGLGAVVTSPLLLAIGAVVGLGAAFAYMSGAAGRVVDWLGGRLGAMKDVAIEAFHGIADALMAGDIETAAKILWVSLKIAWEAGLKTLRWDALKRAAVDTYFGVQEGFADFVFELQKIWFSAIEAMKAAWEGLKNITKNFIEDEANKSAKMGVVAKLAAGQITQEEARKQVAYIDRQSDDAKAANDMSAGAAIAAAENAKNEAIKKAAAAHDKHISEISDSASHAQASVVNGPTDEEKLAALQKELAALLAKARSESGNYGNAMPNGGMPPDLEDLVPGIKSAAKSLGTFSGAAAQGIFGGSVQDHIKRTAKATEEMVKLMKKPVVHQAIVRVG